MGSSMFIRALPPLAFAVALAGCEREPTSPVHQKGEVTGAVARLKTSDGVPNLLVALIGGGRVVEAATTDDDGVFRFSDVPPGSYTVRLSGLELAGIRPATTAFDPEEHEVTVDGATEPVVFAAIGLFTQVLAEVTCGGAPAAEASIRVVGGAVDTLVRTNALGEVAASVDPGHYVLFPADAPCALGPAFAVADVRQGQTVRVSFAERSP